MNGTKWNAPCSSNGTHATARPFSPPRGRLVFHGRERVLLFSRLPIDEKDPRQEGTRGSREIDAGMKLTSEISVSGGEWNRYNVGRRCEGESSRGVGESCFLSISSLLEVTV